MPDPKTSWSRPAARYDPSQYVQFAKTLLKMKQQSPNAPLLSVFPSVAVEMNKILPPGSGDKDANSCQNFYHRRKKIFTNLSRLRKIPGFKWDEVEGMVVASARVWNKQLKARPGDADFRNAAMPDGEFELYAEITGDKVAAKQGGGVGVGVEVQGAKEGGKRKRAGVGGIEQSPVGASRQVNVPNEPEIESVSALEKKATSSAVHYINGLDGFTQEQKLLLFKAVNNPKKAELLLHFPEGEMKGVLLRDWLEDMECEFHVSRYEFHMAQYKFHKARYTELRQKRRNSRLA